MIQGMQQSLSFANRAVCLGTRQKAERILPSLLQQIDIPWERITILDNDAQNQITGHFFFKGDRLDHDLECSRELLDFLSLHLSSGDLLIDLNWNINRCDIISWCHRRGILYVNTVISRKTFCQWRH
jgi:homospermidine synthase